MVVNKTRENCVYYYRHMLGWFKIINSTDIKIFENVIYSFLLFIHLQKRHCDVFKLAKKVKESEKVKRSWI